jgi:hypothetical protein
VICDPPWIPSSKDKTGNEKDQNVVEIHQKLHIDEQRWRREGLSWDADYKSQSHSTGKDLGEKDE